MWKILLELWSRSVWVWVLSVYMCPCIFRCTVTATASNMISKNLCLFVEHNVDLFIHAVPFDLMLPLCALSQFVWLIVCCAAFCGMQMLESVSCFFSSSNIICLSVFFCVIYAFWQACRRDFSIDKSEKNHFFFSSTAAIAIPWPNTTNKLCFTFSNSH